MCGRSEVLNGDCLIVTVSQAQKETVEIFAPISAGSRLIVEIDENLKITSLETDDPFEALNGRWIESDEE